MKHLLILLFFLSTNVLASVYKCTKSDGSVTYSQFTCEGEQIKLDTDNTVSRINTDFDSIDVFTASYAKVKTITNVKLLNHIQRLMGKKIPRKIESYAREENVFIVKKGNAEHNWHIYANGALILYPVNKNQSIQHYFLPNHQTLLEVLNDNT